MGPRHRSRNASGRTGRRIQLPWRDEMQDQGNATAAPTEPPHASLTVHALNMLTGLPATDLTMHFSRLGRSNEPWQEIMKSTTNEDGRMGGGSVPQGLLAAGTYKLRFDTGEYWQRLGHTSFYPYIEVVFVVTEAERKVHIPLLLSPYSYTTYRGS
uniref:5-hydroxyisourate hydrolase n=1 Tax=Varanus komodoensis TaxID=61221 RepID=A0A8D2JD90_VARKO